MRCQFHWRSPDPFGSCRGCSWSPIAQPVRYAQATRVATPGAVQVTGRWHLLRNLSEALKNALSPHHRLFAQAARSGTGEAPEVATAPTPSVPPWEFAHPQKNRAWRFSRYEELLRLGKTGASHASIARQLDLDHRTVRKFLRAETFPEAQRSPGPASSIRTQTTFINGWSKAARTSPGSGASCF